MKTLEDLAFVCLVGAVPANVAGPAISRLLQNDVVPLMRAEGTAPDEVETYHYGFAQVVVDCVRALHHGVLDAQQVRRALRECWSTYVGYDLVQYARAVRLFDVPDLTQAVCDALATVRELSPKTTNYVIGVVMRTVPGATAAQIREEISRHASQD